MKRIGWLLLLLALAACAACTQGDGRLHVLAPEDLPGDLYAPSSPTPTPIPTRTVRVYMTREARLLSVSRLAEVAGSSAELALRSLLAGPTSDERVQRIETTIPDGVGLLGVEVSDGTAHVDLSKEFELGAEQTVLALRLAQVVYTLTDLPAVSSVSFMIDGEDVNVVSEDGSPRNGPVTRSDYASLAPA